MAYVFEVEDLATGCPFHCPVCGRSVYTEEGPTDDPCPHLLFSWINEVGEYENASEEIAAILADDEDCFLTPLDNDFREKAALNSVFYAFTMNGMACGPVSTTVIHAIRFPSLVAE